jgi:hypothetical protein
MSRLWSRQFSAPVVTFSPAAADWIGWRDDNCEVLVRSLGSKIDAAAPQQLVIEWLATGVSLSAGESTERISLPARAVLVHEPAPQLLAGVPLKTLDAKARRIWAGIFLCVRVPVLRGLLRHIASRTRV